MKESTATIHSITSISVSRHAGTDGPILGMGAVTLGWLAPDIVTTRGVQPNTNQTEFDPGRPRNAEPAHERWSGHKTR